MTDLIQHTQRWVESVVVGLNFCPFARREVEGETIRYAVCDSKDDETVLTAMVEELVYLEQHPTTETSLWILPQYTDFDGYLNLLDICQRLLIMEGYEGVLQIASFHPDYCFDGEDEGDAANYTNRSPYPMMHFIREESLERAVEAHPEPESIPLRNVKLAREKGVAYMQTLLANSKK